MADVAVQISSVADPVFSFTDREHENVAFELEEPSRTERAQKDLLALTFQQSEIEKRIGVVRRALLALVQAFGPQVLERTLNTDRAIPNVLSAGSEVPELCREILRHSPTGLTSQQLTQVIQRESPSALAGFTKPGVVTANVLRVLQRTGEVECRHKNGERLCWRSAVAGSRPAS